MAIRVQSGDPAFDALPGAVAEWLEASLVTMALGAGVARGYRAGAAPVVTLREHATALSTAVYLAPDVTTALDLWLRAPMPDGALYDTFSPLAPLAPASSDLNSEPFGAPDTRDETVRFDDLIRGVQLQRTTINAVSESYAVQAAHRAWQATGDDSWLQAHLPVLERALDYLMQHPHRWSSELELPKREFTLDAWPVSVHNLPSTAGEHRDLQAGSREPKWCVHPGDAAQFFAACRSLAALYTATGQDSHAARWRERAEHVEAQTNSVGWNGQFYTHQIHLVPVRVRGVDEVRQLAACNVFAMNAGLASHEQCATVLKEYMRRRELQLETSFCEWWSVQPPFPADTFPVPPGTGANGGCWPLVGGELACAALEHGFESYGVDTLRRYYDLAVKPRRTFPWYALDAAPPRGDEALLSSPHGVSPHDPAGAAAMLRALIEGVCGVRDDGKEFSRITLAPRWPATGQAAAEVEVSYAARPEGSPAAYVTYRWALEGGRMTLDYESKAKHVDLHILLPRGNTPERVALNGRTHEYALVTMEKSKYVDISTERKRGTVAITLK